MGEHMETCDIQKIFSLKLRKILSKVFEKTNELQEIRLRVGQPLAVILDNMEDSVKICYEAYFSHTSLQRSTNLKSYMRNYHCKFLMAAHLQKNSLGMKGL